LKQLWERVQDTLKTNNSLELTEVVDLLSIPLPYDLQKPSKLNAWSTAPPIHLITLKDLFMNMQRRSVSTVGLLRFGIQSVGGQRFRTSATGKQPSTIYIGEVCSLLTPNKITLLLHETPHSPLDPVLFRGDQLIHIKQAWLHLSANLEPYLEA
jgi:hypothetical protein